MRIAIRHSTRYRYDEPVRYSAQSLRLTPRAAASQEIVRWSVEAPGIDKAAAFVDGFGNQVHLITVTEPHQEITIAVDGEVETSDTAGVVQGVKEVAPRALFLRQTDLTRADDSIADLAADLGGEDTVQRLHDLMGRIRDRVEYRVGETHSETTAAEALARGAGVCQDHAHLFIAAARHLGVPARYVSGYLWATEGEPGEAQHAWAEAHIDDLGWVGFDISNGICPDPHYVRVACGLDYISAAPVRGTRRGGGSEALDVTVEVGEAQTQQ
ncbi:MAG: transglutaminase family protein [Hyphomicrobiales bacterium]|nr:transglutaminase family protein [Hyphomicrobiales bacterium]